MHVERYIPQNAKLKVEWDLLEKASMPGFEGEVEASFPLPEDEKFAPTETAIGRGHTAIFEGLLEPGMIVLKTSSLPKELSSIKPGTLIPTDLKSHKDIVRH